MTHDAGGRKVVFKFSRITRAGGRALSKTIQLKDGRVEATPAAELSEGFIEHVEAAGVDALARVIETCKPSQALALGVVIADKRPKRGETRAIVTEAKLAERPGAISRTKKYFVFEQGPGLLLFDHDRNQMPARVAEKIKKAGSVLDALIGVFPQLDKALMVRRSSTSAGLHNAATGEHYRASGGLHIYVGVKDARDIPRALAAAHRRLIGEGYGWCYVTKDGRLLERSIVDAFVGSSERLIFEGSPVLIAPLTQDAEARECEVFDGEPIDSTTTFPELDDAEERRYREAAAVMREERAAEAAIARKQTDKRIIDAMVKRGVDRAEAQRAIANRGDGLPPDVLLFFDNLGARTVADVYAEPEKFIGQPLADPFEPEYGSGKAKIFRNEQTQLLYLTSFAHGWASFDLIPRDDVADAAHRQKVERLKEDFGAAPFDPGALPRKTNASVRLVNGADVIPEKIDWLWRGYLARSKMHLLAGPSTAGKTTVSLALVAVITTGGTWPDGTQCEGAGDVLIWSGEDGRADTLAPRLRAAGADVSKVHFVDVITEGGKSRAFDPSKDMGALAETMDSPELKGKVRLLIIDSLASAVAGDAHRNNEVRRGLQPVVDLAERHGAAVLGIVHFSKGTQGRNVLERVNGSLAFGALARILLICAIEENDDAPNRLLFLRGPSNIGPGGSGWEYKLEVRQVPGRSDIECTAAVFGDPVSGSANSILAKVEGGDGGSATARAEAFLREKLKNGPVDIKEIRDHANAEGVAWRTLERAKRSVGVIVEKIGKVWSWRQIQPADIFQKVDGEDDDPF